MFNYPHQGLDLIDQATAGFNDDMFGNDADNDNNNVGKTKSNSNANKDKKKNFFKKVNQALNLIYHKGISLILIISFLFIYYSRDNPLQTSLFCFPRFVFFKL